MTRAAVLFGVGAMLFACHDSHGRLAGKAEGDGGTPFLDPPPDPAPDCELVEDRGAPALSRDVDLLFVIDNGSSMAEEHLQLASGMPRLVRSLASGDVDSDGVPDFDVPGSLHVGVVTTDMGTNGYAVPGCGRSTFGHNGQLQGARLDCATDSPRFLQHRPTDELDILAESVSCSMQPGTDGCGFAQPLEAALKALTPSSASVEFAAGTHGHADGYNARFLRPDSVLAIVVVTNGDDASVADPEILDPHSARYTGALRVRPSSYPEALHPLQRYVDGFLALRPDRPGRLLFATVAGVPPGLTEAGRGPRAILAHPLMRETIDPDDPSRLLSTCNIGGVGRAYPARRLVELVQRLSERGATTSITSICQADARLVLDGILIAADDRRRLVCSD